MPRWFALALIVLTLSACASGKQTTGGAPADAPSSKLSVDLKVDSKPPGVQVEVMEPNDPQGTAYRKTGKQGVTPCQFTLEQNQPMKYCLEFTKDGYKTEQHEVHLSQNRGQAPQKVGNVIDTVGDLLVSPALWIVAWAVKKIPGSKYLEATPNPLTVTLARQAALPPMAPTPPVRPAPPAPAASPASSASPAPPSSPTPPASPASLAPQASPASPVKSQTIQAVDLSCLFNSLSLSTAQEIPGSGGSIVAKVVPLGLYVRLQDPSRQFSCHTLKEELEKGGKLVFFKGVLETGNQVYRFQDGAFIVAPGPGRFLGCGITSQPLARAEESVKEEVPPSSRKARRAIDEDEEDY